MKESRDFQSILLALNLSSQFVLKQLDNGEASKFTNSLQLAKSRENQLAMSGLIEAIEIVLSSTSGRTSFIRNLRGLGVNPQGERLKKFAPILGHLSIQEERQIFVCPIDPDHYSKPQSISDDVMECPLHKQPLVRST